MLTPRHHIVVALDLSDYAEIVLEHAIDAASKHPAPDLHFLTVAETPGTDVDDLKRKLEALVVPILEGIDRTNWLVRLHVRVGDAPIAITDLAVELHAHLIVIGRFGVHHPNKRLGTFVSRVIELAPSATLVVGLTDQTPDSVQQCPSCVEVRAESEGGQWFCAAHVATDRHLSTLDVSGGFSGGTLMW